MNTITKYTIAIAVSLCSATTVAYAEPADSMAQDVNELKEVVVEGRRVEQIKDGINIRPTKLEKDASFSCWNLLEIMQPPTLKFDPRDKSFKDHFDNPVTYFINREPASKEEVDNLPASLIISVQVLQHPSDPMFQGTASVVNIVAKEYDYGGYTILSAQERFIQKDVFGSVFSKYQRKNWILQFQGTVGYNDVDGSITNNHSVYNFVQTAIPVEIIRNSYSKTLDHKYTFLLGTLRSTLRFGEGERNRFVVTLRGKHDDGPKTLSEGSADYSLTGEHSTTINNNDGKSTVPSIGMSLVFNTADGKYFSIDAGLGGSFNNNEFRYISDFTPEIATYVKEKVFMPSLGFSFSRSVKGNEIYAGLSNSMSRTSADYSGATVDKTHSTLGKNRFYIQYSRSINDKLNFSLITDNGLLYYGSEGFKTRYYYYYDQAAYIQWLPNSKSSASLMGRISNDAPDIAQINSAVRKTDELLEISGNPEISPAITSNIQASYSLYPNSKFNLSATLQWKHVDGLVTTDYMYHDGSVLSRYVNSGSQNLYSLNLFGSLRLLDNKLIVSPGFNVSHAHRGGLSYFDFWTAGASLSANYIPMSGMVLSAMVFSPNPKHIRGYGYCYEHQWNCILSASYKYRNWNFSVRSDPFAKYRHKTLIEKSINHYSRTEELSKMGGRYVEVSVRFQFGYGKKMDMEEDYLGRPEQVTGVL